MMYTYAPFTSIRDYRHSLYATGAKARWFNSKRITEPRKRHHRDFRNAVAVCAKKRRYGLLAGVLAVLQTGNWLYRCAICETWHTSRQSKRENRRRHR